MSTIKISELAVISSLNTDTANTLFVGVDVTSAVTGKLTATTLASGLYSRNKLNVGTTPISLPNNIAQFGDSSSLYVQTNLLNTNNLGTADYVITANTGSDTTSYIDVGFTNSTYSNTSPSNSLGTAIEPLSGYLYVQGTSAGASGGNFILGTTVPGTEMRFLAGGINSQNIAMRITSAGPKVNTGYSLIFGDNTTQNTAAASLAYSTASFGLANSTNVLAQSAFNTANSANVLAQSAFNTANSANVLAQSAYNTANTAVQNTAIIRIQSLTLSGNLVANAVGTSVSIDNFSANTSTFTRNMIVLGTLTANTLLGNVFFSNITTVTSQSNSILWFPQATNPSQVVAQLWYYSNTQSLILDTDISGDRLSISKVLFFRGYNSSGATIPANSFIRLVTGVTANQIPYINLADSTSSANATVAGFVKNSIANGAYGFAYSQGIVEDLDSTGLGTNGDILFLSSTPGRSSNVAPTGANTVVQLGRIIYSNATQGKVFIQNQLRQAYGRQNGSILYAYANNIISSNTISVDDGAGTVTISGNTAATTYNNTWTPTLAFATSQGTQTYSTQVGTYVKVGKMVLATFNIVTTNQTGTGNFSINLSGLPSVSTVSNSVAGSVIINKVGGSVGVEVISPQGSIQASATSVPIFTSYTTSGGGGSVTYRQVLASDLGTTLQISGTIQYISV
jgi:hypothetical protein